MPSPYVILEIEDRPPDEPATVDRIRVPGVPDLARILAALPTHARTFRVTEEQTDGEVPPGLLLCAHHVLRDDRADIRPFRLTNLKQAAARSNVRTLPPGTYSVPDAPDDTPDEVTGLALGGGRLAFEGERIVRLSPDGRYRLEALDGSALGGGALPCVDA